MLYVVATPIGNMSDISFRAIEILKKVALIACEDTRQTRKILTHYDISTRCVSCHSYNERETFQRYILPLLKQEKDVALVSDSGTPLISDPGAAVIEETYKLGFEVSPIPGASAVSAVISVSGLHGKGFWFEGFLGRKTGQRKSRITELLNRNEAFLLFESPHRTLKLLHEIADIDSTREILFAREITKKFETFEKGDVSTVFDLLKKKNIKGECIVLVYPRKK